MMTFHGRRAFLFSALAALGLLGPGMASAAQVTYIALGDSLTFGVGDNDTATDISNGDRGFVKPFADTLASLNGGTRPNVINLGVSGTTTVSFFEGGGGIRSPLDALRNTNYADTTTTQNSLLLATIAEEQAAGREIGYVTITLGSNDLFALVLDPAFGMASDAEKALMLRQTLDTVATRISTLLVGLETIAPEAHVLLLGTYNPLPRRPRAPHLRDRRCGHLGAQSSPRGAGGGVSKPLMSTSIRRSWATRPLTRISRPRGTTSTSTRTRKATP